jgi:hypothetical protein
MTMWKKNGPGININTRIGRREEGYINIRCCCCYLGYLYMRGIIAEGFSCVCLCVWLGFLMDGSIRRSLDIEKVKKKINKYWKKMFKLISNCAPSCKNPRKKNFKIDWNSRRTISPSIFYES